MLRDQPFMRDDTFLGVFQTIGDGLHIPSNLLRLAVAPMLVWSPLTTFVLYLLAGIVVALLHWIVPGAPRAADAPEAEPAGSADAADAGEELVSLAKAA